MITICVTIERNLINHHNQIVVKKHHKKMSFYFFFVFNVLDQSKSNLLTSQLLFFNLTLKLTIVNTFHFFYYNEFCLNIHGLIAIN